MAQLGQFDITNKEQFQELQKELFDATRQLQGLRSRLNVLHQNKRRLEITLGELEEVPAGTNTYKAVGKMFLYRPRDDLKNELQKSIEQYREEFGVLQQQANRYEKKMNECESGLKELMVPRK
mmetsp:Transcript_20439/g.51783  ORF Transcript_20439/g.51783 Transcript_20439/m.51783 type:complete len:123 (-) Transcript_20439:154-522(-)|eukprot:CAMPEP_0177640922 /NCGR_PEP_ID=MMETSP0447-20121125/6800_1 /TAXON_ID=0 /ORGANISM="Stygamoeba regulata, Strain BSH-02190019" /LENGTH=122 /DNA_ID=CAMNT_0019143023 /DNA_START=131 /DNA_END=499 /DNA_ORIENTATION=+